MKIAIVGSRGYHNLDTVTRYVRTLPDDTIIVSGGAVGVDTAAEEAATFQKFPVEILRPDYAAFPKKQQFLAPIARNKTIAERCDRMVAFWDETSNGTRRAIGFALKLGKTVLVFGNDGQTLEPTEVALYAHEKSPATPLNTPP